jgi:hypothetical protein
MPIKQLKVKIGIPYLGDVEGTWEPDESERRAAWEMHVELATRIAVAELQPGEGLFRESLSSLYTLFESTRDILRKYGPTVAEPKGKGNLSFGYLAVAILNGALRPVLSKWHPLLLDYETHRDSSVSPLEHERRWNQSDELRQVLNKVRGTLVEYANLLARVAGVPSLIVEGGSPPTLAP